MKVQVRDEAVLIAAVADDMKTRPSKVNLIQYGLPTSATAASNSRMPTIDNPSPSMPPMTASSTLSTSSCRTIRRRVAPSDTRTEISRDRFADRASRQVCDVRARDEQDETDRAHQREKHQPDRYRFSDWTTRRADGVWWTRERLGDYSPVLSGS
jgi:hypothetical protein